MKYPKIETLYNRNLETFKVDTTELRWPEFGLVRRWLLTEKVDGTNVRIMLLPDGCVEYRGRTDRAHFHPKLLAYLGRTFTADKMQHVFNRMEDGTWPEIILYGEGYGPKIQKGGVYRKDISFRLFDVRIGKWWMNWREVQEFAQRLNIETVPVLGNIEVLPTNVLDLDWRFHFYKGSKVAYCDSGKREVQPEGIVARTEPLLFTRQGKRVMWKLKYKDFATGPIAQW